MKKQIPKQQKLGKLETESVIFVVELNHKFLLSKWLKEIFRKTENLNRAIAQLCRIQPGLL